MPAPAPENLAVAAAAAPPAEQAAGSPAPHPQGASDGTAAAAPADVAAAKADVAAGPPALGRTSPTVSLMDGLLQVLAKEPGGSVIRATSRWLHRRFDGHNTRIVLRNPRTTTAGHASSSAGRSSQGMSHAAHHQHRHHHHVPTPSERDLVEHPSPEELRSKVPELFGSGHSVTCLWVHKEGEQAQPANSEQP